jgi:hypothetical protein
MHTWSVSIEMIYGGLPKFIAHSSDIKQIRCRPAVLFRVAISHWERIRNANEASQKLRKSLQIVVPARVHECSEEARLGVS